ncbi:hypothetical protein FHG87_020234 [Trinorchestia longiramus]|nr:hypothetical protein FHG87_020234 [Trinorchestia longiramus]
MYGHTACSPGLLSQSTLPACSPSLFFQSTVPVYSLSLLSQPPLPVYCPSLLSQPALPACSPSLFYQPKGMEAIKQKNDASVSSLVATERNVSSRRGLRKRRRKKGRKFSAGRRRRLRGRRPRKLRGRGNRRKKLRKHRKPNPAENEVAVDAESISQVSLKGSTSLNHGQGRYRKLHNRRRSRKRRGRRRRKRVSLRVEVGFGEGKMGSSEVFFSRESSQNSILAWHRDRPQVSLARPSRHIHNGLHNATRAMPKTTLLTHTIDNNATRVTHTSDNNATHLTHTIDNNATHLTHAIDNNAYFPTHSKQSNIPSFGSPTAPQNDMKVSLVSGRDTDKTSLHRTHGNRTKVNKDTGQPALCLMNLLGHSSLEGALFIKSGKSPFKLDSRRTYINETADTLRSETQQIDQNAEVEEERKRLLVKEARTRRRHHRRLGKRKLRNTQ